MRSVVCAAVLFLAGCAGGQAPPEWQARTHGALEKFKQYYLEGNVQFAERSFAEAKAASAATGRLELAARVDLVRCALGTAALDIDACQAFESSREHATEQDRRYGDFVSGRLNPGDADALPVRYQALAKAVTASARYKALQQIEDPVSRLIAAGALFRATVLSPDGLREAVDTASAEGYRRPLLAYLKVQARRAELAGDTAALQALQQRIDLVQHAAQPAKQ